MARDIPVTMNMVATASGPGRESPCSMGRQAVPTNIPPLWMIRTKLQIKLSLVLNFHLYLEIYSNSQSFRKMWFASPHRKFYFGNSLGWNIWILQCTRHLKMNVQVIIIIFFHFMWECIHWNTWEWAKAFKGNACQSNVEDCLHPCAMMLLISTDGDIGATWQQCLRVDGKADENTTEHRVSGVWTMIEKLGKTSISVDCRNM